MKQFLITVAGVFVGLVLFAIAIPVLLIAWAASAARPAPTPPASVLALDLREGLTDQETSSPFALLRGRANSVLGLEQVLRAAEHDDHVKGLFVRLPEGGMTPAAADELSAAFRRFRAAGKPIVAMSQGLYADGMVAATYELAAAAGEVWMQPGASFQVTGIARDDMFLKSFFDKYGVKADFQQRYEYKTAVNAYLQSDYTPAHRESELSWMGSVFATCVGSAARDRKQDPKQLLAALVAGPYSAADARAKGLIDKVGQVREAQDSLIGRAGHDARLVRFEDYAAQIPTLGDGQRSALASGPAVAVIGAEGDIMTGSGVRAPNPLTGESTIRSDDISRAFYDAIDDHDVKAIVFRVSSPGGSDTASEQILAAVRAAKAAGKPVVVSMGTYGASGGYWISSQASEIVAEPGTLTGSIGVFGGKLAFGPALARFGVDMRELKVGGDYADAFSPAQAMTPTQTAAVSAWLDKIYAGFISTVASGRRLPPARVAEIAKGRVWTGAQAQALGLVDHLGGFYDAVDRAKALGGVHGQARLVSFGGESSPFEAIRRMFAGASAAAGVARAADDLLAAPAARDLAAAAADARLRAEGATVLAPSLLPPTGR